MGRCCLLRLVRSKAKGQKKAAVAQGEAAFTQGLKNQAARQITW
jgi:hypothetical protein